MLPKCRIYANALTFLMIELNHLGMTFTSLLLKNLWRNKIRTLLTVFGISLGIATIITFGLISSGLDETIGAIIKPGDADFTVAKAGSADVVLSFIDEENLDLIQNIEGVQEVAPYVMTLAPVDNNPFFLVGGMDVNQLELMGVTITDGRAYNADNEAILGTIAAEGRDIKIGDTITANDRELTITGLFETEVTFQSGGAITTVNTSQGLQGINDQVNTISVLVEDGYDVQAVADAVEAQNSELVSIVNPSDFDALEQGSQASQAITWAISLLAIIIGGVGVMNTMIMSVFERTREIGVLRAVGWKRFRIIRMILGEAFVLGVISTLVGAGVGLLFIWGILQTELGQSWIHVEYDSMIFAQAFFVSIAVVIIGSLYPAYRASKMLPSEALRYE